MPFEKEKARSYSGYRREGAGCVGGGERVPGGKLFVAASSCECVKKEGGVVFLLLACLG